MTRHPRPFAAAGAAALALAVLCASSAVARAHASPRRGARPPVVRYVPLDTLTGYWLPQTSERSPWSPTGTRLLLGNAAGVYVYDAARRARAPVLVAREAAEGQQWSPDGSWIAWMVREMRPGAVSAYVAAAPVRRGASPVRVADGDVARYLWASDGTIYYWAARGTRHRAAAVPSRNASITQGPVHPTWLPALASGRLGVRRFLAGPAPREDSLGALSGFQWVLLCDESSDGVTHLVHALSDTSAATRVMDDGGRTRAVLKGLYGTSFVRDGRYVVGHRTEEEGHSVKEASLWIADTKGAWCVPIRGAPSAMNPKMSRTGTLVACEDPDTEALYVGRLVIERR